MKMVIIADRFGDESRAKSQGRQCFSLEDTADMIAAEYAKLESKPIVEVFPVGAASALVHLLSSKGVPVKAPSASIKRIGSADVYFTAGGPTDFGPLPPGHKYR